MYWRIMAHGGAQNQTGERQEVSCTLVCETLKEGFMFNIFPWLDKTKQSEARDQKTCLELFGSAATC